MASGGHEQMDVTFSADTLYDSDRKKFKPLRAIRRMFRGKKRSKQLSKSTGSLFVRVEEENETSNLRKSSAYKFSLSHESVFTPEAMTSSKEVVRVGRAFSQDALDYVTIPINQIKEPKELDGACSMSIGSDLNDSTEGTSASAPKTLEMNMDDITANVTRLNNKAAYDKIALRPKTRKAARKARGRPQHVLQLDSFTNGFMDSPSKDSDDDAAIDSPPKAKRSRPPSEALPSITKEETDTQTPKRYSYIGRSPVGAGPGLVVPSLHDVQKIKLRKTPTFGDEKKTPKPDESPKSRSTQSFTSPSTSQTQKKPKSDIFSGKFLKKPKMPKGSKSKDASGKENEKEKKERKNTPPVTSSASPLFSKNPPGNGKGSEEELTSPITTPVSPLFPTSKKNGQEKMTVETPKEKSKDVKFSAAFRLFSNDSGEKSKKTKNKESGRNYSENNSKASDTDSHSFSSTKASAEKETKESEPQKEKKKSQSKKQRAKSESEKEKRESEDERERKISDPQKVRLETLKEKKETDVKKEESKGEISEKKESNSVTTSRPVPKVRRSRAVSPKPILPTQETKTDKKSEMKDEKSRKETKRDIPVGIYRQLDPISSSKKDEAKEKETSFSSNINSTDKGLATKEKGDMKEIEKDDTIASPDSEPNKTISTNLESESLLSAIEKQIAIDSNKSTQSSGAEIAVSKVTSPADSKLPKFNESNENVRKAEIDPKSPQKPVAPEIASPTVKSITGSEKVPVKPDTKVREEDVTRGEIFSRIKLKPISDLSKTSRTTTSEARRNQSVKAITSPSKASSTHRTQSFHSPDLISKNDSLSVKTENKSTVAKPPFSISSSKISPIEIEETHNDKKSLESGLTKKSEEKLPRGKERSSINQEKEKLLQDDENNNIKSSTEVIIKEVTSQEKTDETKASSTPTPRSRSSSKVGESTGTKFRNKPVAEETNKPPAWVQLARRRSKVWEDAGTKKTTPRTVGKPTEKTAADRPKSLFLPPKPAPMGLKSRENTPKSTTTGSPKPLIQKNVTASPPLKRMSPLTQSTNRKTPTPTNNVPTPRRTLGPKEAPSGPSWLAIAMQKQKRWTKEETA